MLLLGLSLPLLVLAFMLSNTAIKTPAWAAIASPGGMTMLSVTVGALALVNISLLALGMALRGRPSEATWYQLMVALFLATAPLAGGLFLGVHINGLLSLMVVGSALCLMLLERWVALMNICTWLLGVAALTAAEQAGMIAHTPALARLPAGPGGLHTGWLLGPGLISLLGGLVALLVLDQVVSRERSYRATLQDHAHRDPLSGLPDLEVLERALRREIGRATRHAMPLCVAMIELDNLGAINRALGFEVGDSLLRQVAERLERGLRGTDMVAGMGDGRFVILLPHLEHEHVAVTASRLVGLLNDQPLGEARSSIRINARVGLAAWESGLDGAELLTRARQALKEAQADDAALAAVYRSEPDDEG